MKIKLAKDEFELLASGRFLSPDLLAKVQAAALDSKGYGVDITEDEASLIQEACGDELQRSGFDAQDEPTKRGLLLESLIDKFFTGQKIVCRPARHKRERNNQDE